MTSTNAERGDPNGEACGNIDIVVMGKSTRPLIGLFERYGHKASTGRSPGEGEPAVVFLLCDSATDCCEAADDCHRRWPRAPIVIVAQELSSALEEQAATRKFVTMRKQAPNLEELHALAHEVLVPTPSPTPTGLKPRHTDHPPSSR